MISYQQEVLYDLIDEVEPLLELHYQELCLNKEFVKLDPRWDKYAALEIAGSFVIYTAREDGKLVGYSAFFISPHPHYAGLTVAVNDVLFVHPDQRGSVGIRLIKFSEQELTLRLGHFKLTWRAKYTNNLAAILERLGYAREEVVMAKLI